MVIFSINKLYVANNDQWIFTVKPFNILNKCNTCIHRHFLKFYTNEKIVTIVCYKNNLAIKHN